MIRVPAADAFTPPVDRRLPRERVEMMARLRRDLVSATVVLKDLTRLGARVEGVGPLEVDDVVTLWLPEYRPMLAFAIWATEHAAGLEFVEPLPEALFVELVARHRLDGGTPS